MFNFLTKRFKIIILVSLIMFFGTFSQAKAQVFMHPEVFVIELKINEIKEYEIKGEFTVWNNENYYLSDLNYEIKLFQGTEFEKLQLIDLKVPKETFFIAPGQKITKSFTYQYPKNITSNDYILTIQLLTKTGIELTWQDKIISLKGENKFLETVPLSAKILIGGDEYAAMGGWIFYPEKTVTAVYRIKNPGEEIIATPKIKIFQRQNNMPLLKEYVESPITFAKGETKEITLEMPKFDMPESYLAEIKLYQDNEQISPVQYFRWTAEGEGGRILYIKTDKDSYKAGESMRLTIDSAGLVCIADAEDIGTGTLEITVYDKDKNVVAKTSKDVTLYTYIITLETTILIEKDLISPTIEAKIIRNGNILDEHKIELPIFSEQAKQLEKKEKIRTYLIYLIPLMVILIIGFLIYRLKMKKLILFSFTILFLLFGLSFSVFACHPPTFGMVWNEPTPNSQHNLANRLRFSGTVTATLSAPSESSSANLYFFITDSSGNWRPLGNWQRTGIAINNLIFDTDFPLPAGVGIGPRSVKIVYSLSVSGSVGGHGHTYSSYGELTRQITIFSPGPVWPDEYVPGAPNIVVEPYVWVNTSDLTIPDYDGTCVDPLSSGVGGYPRTVSTNKEGSYNDEYWFYKDNVMADDGKYASIVTGDGSIDFDKGDYSYVLGATNFGFSIPSDFTIGGIKVEIERYGNDRASDALVQLTKNGTDGVGANKADTITSWGGLTVKTYGGENDLWGTTWTPAEINASTFGVHLAVQATANNADVYVDFIRISVFLTRNYNCAWNPATTPSFDSGYARAPYPSDDLFCKIMEPALVFYSGSQPVKYTYEWYKNDFLQSDLTKPDTTDLHHKISYTYTSLGDIWKCKVTPKDNYGTTGPSSEATVTIVSSPSSFLQIFERFVGKIKDILSFL